MAHVPLALVEENNYNLMDGTPSSLPYVSFSHSSQPLPSSSAQQTMAYTNPSPQLDGNVIGTPNVSLPFHQQNYTALNNDNIIMQNVAYIHSLEQQLSDAKQLVEQYQIRTQKLMDLVEAQTAMIEKLRGHRPAQQRHPSV